MNGSVREAAERLRAARVESSRTEARLLWEHAQGSEVVFKHLIERRLRHEPIAYITGHKEFWSLDFAVGPGVLIPRPETETLIEAALDALPNRTGAYRILDLGTGSGCLLVALLSEYRNAEGVGIDTSEASLAWAKRNVSTHRLERRADLVRGGWEAAEGPFDVIVSNPPYIRTGDMAALPPDIRDYEPLAALDGGPDGLHAYLAVAPVLKDHLKPAGFGFLEIGAGQHHMVGEIMAATGLEVARPAADLAGIPRCVVVRAP